MVILQQLISQDFRVRFLLERDLCFLLQEGPCDLTKRVAAVFLRQSTDPVPTFLVSMSTLHT